MLDFTCTGKRHLVSPGSPGPTGRGAPALRASAMQATLLQDPVPAAAVDLRAFLLRLWERASVPHPWTAGAGLAQTTLQKVPPSQLRPASASALAAPPRVQLRGTHDLQEWR
jgi:hypothetical protein